MIVQRALGVVLLGGSVLAVTAAPPVVQPPSRRLSAGAATSNITPPLGELIVGNWTPVPATHVHDELYARCLVLDDGATRVAIVVADNVGIPRRVLDEAKRLTREHAGLPVERILIASTHTHSATTARGPDGEDDSGPLDRYQTFLAGRIADGIRRAINNLEPARIGWGRGTLPGQVFNRRWFMTPGDHLNNPFGGTDKVRMNPPMASPNLVKPAGPTDPEIRFLSVTSDSGRPIALLANYSLHYVGGVPNGHVSADYFGAFAREMSNLVGGGAPAGEQQGPPFVAMLSNGTSGDINNIDFRGGQKRLPDYARMELVAREAAAEVYKAMQGIAYRDSVPLGMIQRELTLQTRRPAPALMDWARGILARPEDTASRFPRERIYAERTLRMARMPPRIDVPLQALRIGDLAVVTIPFEVFVEIGLELKAKSPFPDTFTISLANGAYGYLPTPAHHELGGYETWLGTNQVELQAAPKIVAALVEMLERLRGPAGTDKSPRNIEGPLSPDEALGSFELEPGYRMELAAAEPLIQAPVAMAFDERGRMYVVENRGYPGALEGVPERARLGAIALLEDKDGDGRFDTRSEFAGGLAHPNGIAPWNGGVFVTAAPDLLYLKDTTGDGIADERRIILTGFDASRTPQIRVSHPTLAIDNWLYLTSGLTGGLVTAPEHPDRAAVKFGTSDSRVNPLTHAFELTGGQGQFGLTFDDHGRRFVCSNRHPVMHVVLEPRYLERNAHLAFSRTMHEVSAAGAQATVWPIAADMTTASFHPSLINAPHAGTFTAASGVHIHRGDALPASHGESVFICESAQNLVQRQIRSPDGVTFTSRPARAGREFLASRDGWFRPVFAANGPDGALYVVDMYRKFIDHPQYVPEASRPLLDFEAGKDRGRIYRIVGRDWQRDRKPVDLGRMNADELTTALDHPNAWWRETAQRLLVERRDPRASTPLRAAARRGRREATRIHALWTLDGLGALDAADLATALRDPHAAVRENALRLAETRLGSAPDLAPEVLRLAEDSDARVRFRAALALGETKDPRAVDALASVARRDGAQSWVRAAVLSSIGGRSNEFLRAFVASPAASETVRAAVMQDLGQVFGAGETAERCLDLIVQIADPAGTFGWQPAALAGIAQGLRARGLGRDGRSAFMTLLHSDAPQAAAARRRVEAILSRASALAADDRAPIDGRLAAIGLLGHTDYPSAGRALEGLLAPRHAVEIQSAAVRALSQLPERAAAASLVEPARWLGYTPQVREAALSALLASEAQVAVVLDAVESGSIPAAGLAPSRRTRLVNHRNADIQKRARALFAAVEAGDRMQVYERLRGPVLARPGRGEHGKRLFASRCAACHTFDAAGGRLPPRLGPDLSGIRNQPADAILLHLLVPSYEITPGYEAYLVETHDGRTLAGRLESEAPNSVTLRDASAQSHVILRREIASMSASSGSLMPGELERGMSEQDLADLIAYLKSPR